MLASAWLRRQAGNLEKHLDRIGQNWDFSKSVFGPNSYLWIENSKSGITPINP